VLVESGLKNIYLSITSFRPGIQVSSKRLIIRAYFALTQYWISNSPETYPFDLVMNKVMEDLEGGR